MSKNRTIILHLPGELLEKILDSLEEQDLLNCQRVCRALYNSAHLKLLHCISLNNISLANHFINAIDSNPDHAYLNAVKKIKITDVLLRDRGYGVFLSKQILHKLFFRFPNLTHIEVIYQEAFIKCLAKELCDETYETLLQYCPKLENFIVHYYNEHVWPLRHLLTGVRVLGGLNSDLPPGVSNFVEYITRFPRIRQLKWNRSNFEEILQVIERSPSLTELDTPIYVAHQEDLNKLFKVSLSRRTQPQQDLLLKRMSEITVLRRPDDRRHCTDSIDFILKYFTGLKTFDASVWDPVAFDSTDHMEFWSKIIELKNTVDEVDLCYRNIHIDSIMHYYRMENAMNCNPTTRQDPAIKRLEVVVGYRCYNCFVNVNISFRRKLSKHSVTIYLDPREAWGRFYDMFLKDSNSGRKIIDELAISFGTEMTNNPDLVKWVKPYSRFLENMSSLKRVIFDVPASFKKEHGYSSFANPTVEELTIQGEAGVISKESIHRLRERLPNLKHLCLMWYSGDRFSRTWKLDLATCSLKSISIDVRPIVLKMSHSSNCDFFVVCLRKGKNRYVYKVSTSLWTYRRIRKFQLILKKRDYVTVDITVDDLQQLKLFYLCDSMYDRCSFDYLDRCKNRANIIIKCQDDQ